MCIFKSQLIDKGTNKVTKENVVFDTTSSRYDLAIKEVEERVKLGWSVKASFMLGGGYLRVDYVWADPNRYKDVGKTNDSKVDAEIVNTGSVVVGATEDKENTSTQVTTKTTRKTTAKKSEVKDDEWSNILEV